MSLTRVYRSTRPDLLHEDSTKERDLTVTRHWLQL
jgi:hypothetical protein